jgi:hypothetical protein
MGILGILDRCPVRVAQAQFVDGTGDQKSIITAIRTIVTERKWVGRKQSNGTEFGSFGEFAIALAPYGMGARTQQALEFLRFLLLTLEFTAEWSQVLALTVRDPGRPPEMVTNGDSPVFVMSKSPTSSDRLLHRLRASPGIQARVFAGDISIYRGAVEAGLVRPLCRQLRGYDLADLEAASGRKPEGRCLLLSQLFEALGLETQCTFISRVLEPRLGPGLARGWRHKDDTR